jgi:hypothetical protein
MEEISTCFIEPISEASSEPSKFRWSRGRTVHERNFHNPPPFILNPNDTCCLMSRVRETSHVLHLLAFNGMGPLLAAESGKPHAGKCPRGERFAPGICRRRREIGMSEPFCGRDNEITLRDVVIFNWREMDDVRRV